MLRLSCKCGGIISEKCKCSSIHSSSSDGLVVSTQPSSGRCPQNRIAKPKHHKEESNTNLVMRILGDFYEKCAAYNLRYCSITGFVMHSDNYFRHVMKDVVVLICFIATNLIVCVGITSKTIVHMLLFFSITLKWLMRKFFVKIVPLSGRNYLGRHDLQNSLKCNLLIKRTSEHPEA